jgi:GT2 family glycosyltransferase
MTATAVHDQVKRGGEAGVRAGYRIAVVIVHYKTPGMLVECVESLLPELRTGTGEKRIDELPVEGRSSITAEGGCATSDGLRVDHVVIVDNASGAEHVAGLGKLRGKANVTLIESEKNLGFAGANNLAIRHVMEQGGAEYFLLLNPDTILRAGAVETLLRFLESHPEAACVGPRLEDPDGTAQQSAFRDPTPVSEFLRGASIGPIDRLLKRWQVHGPILEKAQATDWLAGACVLMRREMVEKVGLLDDRFFMYFEEVDYFRRARAMGFQAWYEPAAHVVHLVGQSSGINVAPGQKRLPKYWFESRHRYFRKHFGWVGTLFADWCWVNGHVLDRLRKVVTGTSHASPAKFEVRDLIRHSWRQLAHPFRTRPGGGV